MIACGSYLTGAIKGKTIQECASVEAHSIVSGLGGMPISKLFCADIAVEALRRCLRTIN